METLLNFISTNASAFLSLLGVFITCVTTMVVSVIGIRIYKINLKSSRKSLIVQELIQKKINSCGEIKKFILENKVNNTYITDYKNCKLISTSKDKLIPAYYEIFENLTSLETYKKSLEEIIQKNNTLSSNISLLLTCLYSYINNIILLYNNLPNFFQEDTKWFLYFISIEFHKWQTYLSDELDLNYISSNYEKHEKEYKYRSKRYKKYKKEFLKQCKNSPYFRFFTYFFCDDNTIWKNLSNFDFQYKKKCWLLQRLILLFHKTHIVNFFLKIHIPQKWIIYKYHKLNLIRDYEPTYNEEEYSKIRQEYESNKINRLNILLKTHYLQNKYEYDRLCACKNCTRWILLT